MLDPDQVEKIRLLLRTSSWNDVVLPVLRGRAATAMQQLIRLPSERAGEYKEMSDEAIKQRIRDTEWMMTCWANEIFVADHNRQNDELEAGERAQGVGVPRNGPSTANP